MHLGEIIKEFRQARKISMDDFSALSGLSKSYISMLEKNVNTSTGKEIAPTVDAIKKVSKATGIEFNNLFAMLGDDIVSINDNLFHIPPENIIFDDYFPLHYSTNLSAGSLEELLDLEPDAIVYVPIKYQAMKKRLNAFKVNGTSMDNIIADGSIVVAENINKTGIELKDGTIIVAWVDGNATVKRFYKNDNQITLMPDSKDKSHLPIVINLETSQVSVIGRVIWHMNPDDIEKHY